MGTVAIAIVQASLALTLGAPAWPLRADASGHRLEDRLGHPFLITSDSAWCLVNGLTDEELDTYLAARQAQGFNTVLFMLMSKHEHCAVGAGRSIATGNRRSSRVTRTGRSRTSGTGRASTGSCASSRRTG